MTKPVVKVIKAARLVLDYELYPRHEISASLVADLVRARKAGETLPPIIVDARTLRVVDGFHRTTAALRHDGEKATVQIEAYEYADEAAVFLDAVARNARHGYKLTKFDAVRCLQRAEELSIAEEAIAGALAVTVDVTAKLRAAKTAYDEHGKPLAIKRTLRHLSGSRLTGKQQKYNLRASGWSIRFHAQQIIEAIGCDAVDWQDEETTRALSRLAAVLGERMAVSL
jgi:hypothetical protein